MKAPGRTVLDIGVYILSAIQVLTVIVEGITVSSIIFTNAFIPYTSIGPYAAIGPMAASSVFGGFDWFMLNSGYFRNLYITAPLLVISAYSKQNIKDIQKTVWFAIVFILFALGFLFELFKLAYYSYALFFACSNYWFCVSFNPASPVGMASTTFFIVYVCNILWMIPFIGLSTLLVVGLRTTVEIASYQSALVGEYSKMGSRPGHSRNMLDCDIDG